MSVCICCFIFQTSGNQKHRVGILVREVDLCNLGHSGEGVLISEVS